MQFTFNMTWTDIDAGTTVLAKRTAGTKRDLHKLNVSVLARWLETNDAKTAAEKASAIVNGVEGYYAQAVANWFAVHAGFQWDAKAKAFAYTRTTTTLEECQAAKAETFEQVSPPQSVKPFDMLTKLESLLSAATKRMSADVDKRTEEDKVSTEEVNVLAEAIASIKAKRG